MSNTPSYASPSLNQSRQGISATALTSFILGLILCIPVIPSLIAIPFAIVGFKATRRSALRGRGFAVAGLILSIVNLLLWSGFAAFIIIGSEAPRHATLHTFAHNLFSGNVPAAAADCDPSVITPEQLEKVHEYTLTFGAYSDLTCTSVNLSATAIGETCQLSGKATFSSGSHLFTATLIKSSTGVWKIYNFHIY